MAVSSEPDNAGWGLVMPFVVCESAGGNYADVPYVAGFEAGRIDAALEWQRPESVSLPVHVENLPQLDLIAMRRGYTLDIAEPESDGWE